MFRKPTLNTLDTRGAIVRAQTPDDASLAAMFGPPADGERMTTKRAVYSGVTWHVIYTDKDGQFHSEEWVAGTLAEVEHILTAIGATYWEIG